MMQSKETAKLLTTHYEQYPHMQITDLFKFIHQSSFGCEHMVTALDSAVDYIEKERKNVTQTINSVTPLDGEYSRVHLTRKSCGLSSQTLGKLFFESAKEEIDGRTNLENKLLVAEKLINENILPFSFDEFNSLRKEWKKNGYPSVHHSEIFHQKHSPSYRVISNKYIPFLPFFIQLDKMLENGSATVAIEGGSASGKTTLGKMLEEIYSCTIIHMDDFFLRPEQRTKERYSEIGGNIDKERFWEEVLIPLKRKDTLCYRKFDCSSFTLTPPVKVTPKKLVIIEGAYSMHSELAGYYDFSLFLEISPEKQKMRIKKRNSPQMVERFFNEWIPLEQRYFSETHIKNRCNMIISIS